MYLQQQKSNRTFQHTTINNKLDWSVSLSHTSLLSGEKEAKPSIMHHTLVIHYAGCPLFFNTDFSTTKNYMHIRNLSALNWRQLPTDNDSPWQNIGCLWKVNASCQRFNAALVYITVDNLCK